MIINSLDSFRNYYEKYGKCINQINKPKHRLTDKELESKYDTYVRSNIKESKVDDRWISVRDYVHRRDNETCRFLSKLKKDRYEDYKYLIQNVNYTILSTLDPAHIVSRAESKNLYYEVDNIILLNRYSHSMIDSYHDPIYGKSITKEERENWFRYIVGDELFEKLLLLK